MRDSQDLDGIGLERNVRYAIKYNLTCNFESKEKEECEYMQKFAEGELSIIDIWLAVSTFEIGGSVAIVSAGISINNLFFIIAGIIPLVVGTLLLIYWIKRRPRCTKIVLGIEKKIQSENFKKRKVGNI